MSQSAITTAFESYLASQLAAGEPVTLDQFIFANVPGLDPDEPIDRENEIIPVDNIVYQQAVTLPGVINENEVVYSITMGTDVGDFDFNWIGLVNQETGLLAMVTHAPVQQKFMNASGQQGNTLTRSFLMEYSGAAAATTITTPAETWQIDFTARLMSMDDRQRLENTDIYGDGAFFNDSFLVTGSLSEGYQINQGTGYVGGLRVTLAKSAVLDAETLPATVWVDACWKGTLTSIWQTETTITLADTLANYFDDLGLAHYVFAVASIDADGAITDLRPQGSRDNQQLTDYLRINQNLAEIASQGEAAQAETRGNLGLTDMAIADSGDFVPSTRKVNDKQLNDDITLDANDVGALPITGGKVTGNVDIVGDGTREPLSIKGTSASWVGSSVTNLDASGGSYFNFNLGANETPVSGINSYYVNGSICLELTASTAFVDGQNNRKSMFRLNPDMGTVGSMDGWPLCDNGERVYSSLNPPPPPEAGWNQNIGAHLFAQIGPGDASPGSTWSGSALAPMSLYYSSSTRAAFHAGGYGDWAGTWMMLGQCSAADGAEASGTMFVRIA